MLEHIELFFKSIFVDNMVFAYFLGMCSYLAVSKKVSTAVGLGAAVIFVLTVTVPLNWLLDQYILQDGALVWLGADFAAYNLSFLSFILFIATIATMVQLGMGTNGQYLDIIPSQNLVIIRMGEAPDSDDLLPINFHNEMWSYLNDILF